MSQEFDENQPGFNYTYIADHYPVPTHDDLDAQVARFLQSKPLKNPPKETLWVFNFGMWDAWTLAALPREAAVGVVDYMVLRLFQQIEILYKASLADTSIAFSDFWGYADADVIEKLKADKLEDVRGEREIFRVLIPRVVDISITPGWDSMRPRPPLPHSPAVHMTNAAYLTKRWNDGVASHIAEWQNLPNPETDETVDPDRAEARKRHASAPNQVQKSENQRKRRGAGDDLEALLAPFPLRKALQYDAPYFVLEAIVERQLRNAKLRDELGRGERPPSDPLRFDEVWRPCSEGDAEPQQRIFGSRVKTDADANNANQGESERDGSWHATCSNPDKYLWETPFTLTDKATREFARLAAAESDSKLELREQTSVLSLAVTKKSEDIDLAL